MSLCRALAVAVAAMALLPAPAAAQTVENRAFIEGRLVGFTEEARNDWRRLVSDVLVREEVFLDLTEWLQVAAGVDLRANSHGHVENDWRFDYEDRGIRRPQIALRRLSMTLRAGALTLDLGKQFLRWGRTDILSPTDRFAPRDFMNVVDTEFLAIVAVHPEVRIGSESFEAVWVPQLTPSRLPLFDQRWTVMPPDAQGIPIVDGGSRLPERSQTGARWRHAGRFDLAVSYFDGFNHLPNIEFSLGDLPPAIELTRTYPDLRTYGVDAAIPTRWFTFKGEAAFFESPSRTSEEYVLYVLELERLIGEWTLAGGYAGEVVTTEAADFPFAFERGMARSIVGRAAYTVDPQRTFAIEGAVRQNGDGLFIKAEYSTELGSNWRLMLTGVGIQGKDEDFLGQFRRNSHVSMTLRFSD